MECERCTIFMSANQFGGQVEVYKSAPPKNALARNEVLADEGSAAERFGQDDFRGLSELQ